MLLTDDLESNKNTIEFTNHLKKGGLYVIGSVLLGSVETRGDDVRDITRRGYVCGFCYLYVLTYYNRWDTIRKLKIKGFYELIMGSTVRSGAANLILTAGLGGMRPNTVIMGFFRVSLRFHIITDL